MAMTGNEEMSVRDSRLLQALIEEGVDNWSAIDEALDEYEEENGEGSAEVGTIGYLRALEEGGVDNWSGYGYAIDDLIENYGEDWGEEGIEW